MRKVVGIFETDPTADQEDLGTALANLATVLREVRAFPEAMTTAQKAVSILEPFKKSDHFPVSLITLGQLHMDEGDSASAEAILQRARESIENLHKEDSPTLALVFAHLGVFYRNIGRHREAEPYLELSNAR